MKASEFKKIIKESVREVIQEELKEILLEAIKSPKQRINETYIQTPHTNINTPQPTFTPPTMNTPLDIRSKYMDVLGETAMSFTSNDVTPFIPPSDTVNGNLGTGEVGLDQISSLLNLK